MNTQNQNCYVTPEVETMEMSVENFVCTSKAGGSTEGYKQGDTGGWY